MTPTPQDAQNQASPHDPLHEPLDSLSLELARISAEIHSINSGFQEQMQHALIEARTAVDKQYRVRLEQSITEVQATLRVEIQNEFRTHFEKELAERTTRLEEVKQEQMQQALAEARTAIDGQYRARLEQSIIEVQAKLQNEFRTHFEEELAERTTRLEEVKQEQMKQALVEAQAQIQNDLRTHFEEELEKRLSHLAGVRKEIEAVSGRLESIEAEITAMLDDPSVELSKVIPKRTQQTELSAYLKGLRYSIGE